MFGTDIFSAAARGHVHRLQTLIEGKAVDVNTRDAKGRTPLHVAVEKGQLDVAKYLIAKGAEIGARTKEDDLTPLGLVFKARKQGPQMAALLIENGADANERYATSITVLMLGVRYGNLETIKVLLSGGADVNLADKNGLVPLWGAIMMKRLDVVRLLLEKGADVERPANRAGVTGIRPLHMATIEGQFAMVQLLLEAGADIKATCFTPDRGALTSRELALEEGHGKLAKLLEEAENQTGKSGQ